MEATYWFKQTDQAPLFPDMLWSRPENKLHAGKLLIIGGNKFHFSAPGLAFAEAEKTGIGTAKVMLPDVLKKTIGSVLENCEFAPTNKSGGFARNSLGVWLDNSSWADAVLLAGDVGRNSETAVVIEEFARHYDGDLVITQDCLDQFTTNPQSIFSRPKTTIVASFGQLQKMWPRLSMGGEVLKFRLPLSQNLLLMHELTITYPVNIITKHNDDMIVSVNGKISTTHNGDEIWRVKTAAHAAVWLLQNPTKPFEALTTAVNQMD